MMFYVIVNRSLTFGLAKCAVIGPERNYQP